MVLDVGNTHTVVGLFDDAHLRRCWRLATVHNRNPDEIGIWLREFLALESISPSDLAGVAVSSVVPPLDDCIRQGIHRFFGQPPFFVEPGIRTDMPLLVDTPEELGADRLCDAVAAYALYGGPCVVLDFGTAVTWEVVSAEGEYLGGVIAPGPGLTARALHSKTAKLPPVSLSRPPRVIGKGTVDSIQAGLYYGYVGLVEEITRRILGQVPGATVIATGGFAPLMAEATNLIQHLEPDLTLIGLQMLWRKNRQNP
jgi:type III pantothenate kinase